MTVGLICNTIFSSLDPTKSHYKRSANESKDGLVDPLTIKTELKKKVVRYRIVYSHQFPKGFSSTIATYFTKCIILVRELFYVPFPNADSNII